MDLLGWKGSFGALDEGASEDGLGLIILSDDGLGVTGGKGFEGSLSTGLGCFFL